MATSPKADDSKEAGLTIQRGSVRLALQKSNHLFAVKKMPHSQRGVLTATIEQPGAFPGVKFQKAESQRDIEVYHVDAGEDKVDGAMDAARDGSRDTSWCAHVYHIPGDPAGLMIPTDRIYVELVTDPDQEAVIGLLEEHKLELMPADEANPNAYVVRLTAASKKNPIKIANELAESSQVKVAEPDFSVKAELNGYRPSDTLFPKQWHLENPGGIGLTAGADVSAPDAWELLGGRGNRSIVVAVIDDGVQTDHPEFSSEGKIVSPADFAEHDVDPSPASDDDNHGTACAGVAVADENGGGVVGIAPNCALMPIRSSGFVDDQSIKEWFDHARTSGADIISCSWGAGLKVFPLSTSMHNTIRMAARDGSDERGCVIVFAAGNDDRPVNGTKGGVSYKSGFAVHPDVIAVSASNSLDTRSHYSNYGPEVWVCAPSSGLGGQGILTTDRTGSAGYQSGDYTTVVGFGGTSSSAPLVAGVSALMLSANPQLTSAEVKEILKDTSDKIDQANGDYNADGHSDSYGWGRVNAARAVKEARRRIKPPCVISPAPGSFLSGPSATFTWTADGEPILEWWLYAGSKRELSDYFDSGTLGSDLSAIVGGLPTDGSSVFVRLWHKTSTSWRYSDFEYTAASIEEPEVISPTPGSALPSSSVVLAWAAKSAATISSTAARLARPHLRRSPSLPIDGRSLSARLWYKVDQVWMFRDFAYTGASGVPAITSPMPGSTLQGASVTFEWTANGAPVVEWWLYVGFGAGEDGVFNSGSLGTALSIPVQTLPSDRIPLFTRLWSRTYEGWDFSDVAYSASAA